MAKENNEKVQEAFLERDRSVLLAQQKEQRLDYLQQQYKTEIQDLRENHEKMITNLRNKQSTVSADRVKELSRLNE